jgi:serine/threonine-protein kinase
MAEDPRVQQLLDELLESNSSPETVCASCPELLPVLRARWRDLCRLRADLDKLFPTPDEPIARQSVAPFLPQIPGYEVESVLGRGATGVVYKARDVRLNRPVAIKMMLADGASGLLETMRFLSDAQLLTRFWHPNVVQTYEVGGAGGLPYFAMEYIEGGSLAEKLTGVPWRTREASELVVILARAVQAAHEANIVHRDLKPGNVLMTREATPKISDFGVIRRLHIAAGLTRSGRPIGSPSYMAPELSPGHAHEAAPAVDIYALGAMLYELLTGRPPFQGETASETILQVISTDPVPPSRLNAEVPRDLQTICMKCLEKDPTSRYSSAGALADDLDRFLKQ